MTTKRERFRLNAPFFHPNRPPSSRSGHIHPRRDDYGICTAIGEDLPRIPTLSINLRNHLPVFLVGDLCLDVEETPVHLQVLLLVVHSVEEVADSSEDAEVKLALDFEDLSPCW